ncbi:MAG: hypothetical protein D6776_12245, partial [Planctomycetota bacterium]
EELLELIALHAERTASARAREILDRWDELYIRFWRVAPRGAVASIEQRHEGAEPPRARAQAG